ncbi:SpaA isopeptide-forming pilin-related protein [Intestinimonas massiliensis (ex Afouda et al. 2020)]|uniref:SpaA isopeptide-forming pilin-related protein n=1 Tax=Intestinimonas massiliensis (ex Afouda et al. 2020) TaxID=1673721 RepID=UPI0034A02023
MKRRLLSLFLAFVTMLSLLPTAAFAASSEEEALGEVDIYNGDYELGYLAINGSVRKQIYTYFLYEANDGTQKESPAYCVTPNQYGVPQTVGPGESIKYLADEKASDPKVVGIISNGYPHRSLGELKLDNKYQAYYATKMALWCYLLPNWDIANLKVAPGLSGSELDIGNRILAAAKDIYKRGTTYNYMLTPRMTVTADKSTAYPVTIGGQAYLQQVFTVWSETWVYDYDVAVAFSDPDSVPEGAKIVDTNNKEITAVTTKYTSDGYAGTFKVLYPAGSVEGQSGNVQFSLSAPVAQYAAMYAVCQEKDQYGDLQNYICDLDNKVQLDVAAVSSYADSGEPDPDETALKIVKLEEGTEIPLEGAVFSVYDPEGKKVGSYSTGPDGTVTIPLTLEGHYTVTEEIPPRYHLLPEETTQHADVEYDKTATLTFWNAPYGSLRVEKRSDTGDALSGVTIQIKHIETGETRTGQTRNGVIVFDELAPGGWEVRELAGIDGWVADTDTVQTVAVVTGQESTATIINKELPGLRITKYERGTMTLMPNVSFEIFRDAESLGIFTTDEFGQILLTNCEPGTYRAEERDTGGDGHVLDTTPQEVELKAGDGIKDLVFFNDRLPGIHLIKVDSSDLSKPIANARFRIEAVDGSWGPEEYTTSEDGAIDLSKLPVGTYVVTELECPGYIVDDAQRIIHLDGGEQAQFVFTNSKLPSLHLYKESADGTPLGGVTYRLARIEDGSRYLDRTTGPDGSICWEGLEPGVYFLQEVSTVSDHILDPTEYHVELFPGKDATICLQNDKRPNLTIHKSDADTGAPVPGTVFLVKGADGHSVAEVTTGQDGSATVENLLPGVYEVSEKSVPSPYLLDADPQLVTLYPNRDRDVYFENHKRPTVTIQKENSVTNDPIQYAEFHITWSSNKTETGEQRDLGTFQTDEAGQIVLEGIEDGWLTIKETKPAPGYQLPEDPVTEVYVKGGENKTVTISNIPLSALVVYKQDSVTGAGISGCRFQLKYLGGEVSGSGGTVVGTYTTSANGSFTVTGLRKGYYICEELESDSGHVIDAAPQSFYISGEDQDIVTLYFSNAPKGAVLVKKVSSADNSPLSDVEFLVTTSAGAVVGDANGKFVTDSTGTFLVEGVEPGTTLVIKETRAKDGYLLDNTPQTVQVKEGQTVTVEFRNQPIHAENFKSWICYLGVPQA